VETKRLTPEEWLDANAMTSVRLTKPIVWDGVARERGMHLMLRYETGQRLIRSGVAAPALGHEPRFFVR